MRTLRPSSSVNSMRVSVTVVRLLRSGPVTPVPAAPPATMQDDTGIVFRNAGRSVPRVQAVILGLLAALTGGAQALINKGLTERYPARQLIGVLYVTNCLVLLPFAPFVSWHWS